MNLVGVYFLCVLLGCLSCVVHSVSLDIAVDAGDIINTDVNNDVSGVNLDGTDSNGVESLEGRCSFGLGFLPISGDVSCENQPDEILCGDGYTCVEKLNFVTGDLMALCCSVGNGTCHKESHQGVPVLGTMTDTFVVSCNEDGTFTALQCVFDSCHCSTPDGIRLRLTSFANSNELISQELCEDLVSIYKNLCDAESDLEHLLERLVKLYETAKKKWQKEHPAPDPSGRDELNELWDLILCIRKLLIRVKKLKTGIDSGQLKDFGDIQAELQSILKSMAEKVKAMFELIGRMDEMGFRERDIESLGDAGDSLDDVQDDLLEALLDATDRALDQIAENEKDPVADLPQEVTDMCNNVDRLLQKCLDLLTSYQAIRKKLKKLAGKWKYPYEEMSNLFGCISDYCDAVNDLHDYLMRIKCGELDPKDDDTITKLGELVGKVQKASASLLQYKKDLLDKLTELGLEDRFEALLELNKKSLNALLENIEKLVDSITESFNDLFLDALGD